jgi:hypothetical protein
MWFSKVHQEYGPINFYLSFRHMEYLPIHHQHWGMDYISFSYCSNGAIEYLYNLFPDLIYANKLSVQNSIDPMVYIEIRGAANVTKAIKIMLSPGNDFINYERKSEGRSSPYKLRDSLIEYLVTFFGNDIIKSINFIIEKNILNSWNIYHNIIPRNILDYLEKKIPEILHNIISKHTKLSDSFHPNYSIRNRKIAFSDALIYYNLLLAINTNDIITRKLFETLVDNEFSKIVDDSLPLLREENITMDKIIFILKEMINEVLFLSEYNPLQVENWLTTIAGLASEVRESLFEESTQSDDIEKKTLINDLDIVNLYAFELACYEQYTNSSQILRLYSSVFLNFCHYLKTNEKKYFTEEEINKFVDINTKQLSPNIDKSIEAYMHIHEQFLYLFGINHRKLEIGGMKMKIKVSLDNAKLYIDSDDASEQNRKKLAKEIQIIESVVNIPEKIECLKKLFCLPKNSTSADIYNKLRKISIFYHPDRAGQSYAPIFNSVKNMMIFIDKKDLAQVVTSSEKILQAIFGASFAALPIKDSLKTLFSLAKSPSFFESFSNALVLYSRIDSSDYLKAYENILNYFSRIPDLKKDCDKLNNLLPFLKVVFANSISDSLFSSARLIFSDPKDAIDKSIKFNTFKTKGSETYEAVLMLEKITGIESVKFYHSAIMFLRVVGANLINLDEMVINKRLADYDLSFELNSFRQMADGLLDELHAFFFQLANKIMTNKATETDKKLYNEISEMELMPETLQVKTYLISSGAKYSIDTGEKVAKVRLLDSEPTELHKKQVINGDEIILCKNDNDYKVCYVSFDGQYLEHAILPYNHLRNDRFLHPCSDGENFSDVISTQAALSHRLNKFLKKISARYLPPEDSLCTKNTSVVVHTDILEIKTPTFTYQKPIGLLENLPGGTPGLKSQYNSQCN